MGSKEEAGKRCPAVGGGVGVGGVSSFTIQSILGGGPSEAPREPAGWPALRKRSLSVSSEEEEPDDGWKAPACFCPDPHGPKEPGPKHHHHPPPVPFPGLGKDRGRALQGEGRREGGRARALVSNPAGQSPGRSPPPGSRVRGVEARAQGAGVGDGEAQARARGGRGRAGWGGRGSRAPRPALPGPPRRPGAHRPPGPHEVRGLRARRSAPRPRSPPPRIVSASASPPPPRRQD